MNQPILQELEKKLLVKGYSRRYAQRLVGELTDHWTEINTESEGEQSTALKESTERIGELAILLEAIEEYRELDPLPRKYPQIYFVIFPAVLLCSLMILWLYTVNQWIPQQLDESRFYVTKIWNVVHVTLLLALPLAGWGYARRYRVPGVYVALMTLLLICSTFFSLASARCVQSGGLFIYSGWISGSWFSLIPMVVFICGLLLSARCGARDSHHRLNRANLLGSCDRLLVAVLIAVVSVLGARYLIIRSLHDVKKHPLDNLVQQFNREEFRRSRFVRAISDPKFRAEVLSMEQGSQVGRIVDNYNSEIQTIRAQISRSRENAELVAELQANQSTRLTQVYDTVVNLLSPDQRSSVRRQGLRLHHWSALYDEELRREIGLTAYQFRRVKEVSLKFTLERQHLMQRWKNLSPGAQVQLQREADEFATRKNQAFVSILTKAQIQRLGDLVPYREIASKKTGSRNLVTVKKDESP